MRAVNVEGTRALVQAAEGRIKEFKLKGPFLAASLVAFRDDGTVRKVEYGWAILAPQPRWIIPVGT